MNDKKQCIILIGPMGVGKTTIAKRLAKTLNLPYINCDQLRHKYFAKMSSYDKDEVKRLQKADQALTYYYYMNAFELAFIERILKDYPKGVFDFGGGHSVYATKMQNNKMMQLLEPYHYVFFLRYCQDIDTSIAALSKRHKLPYGVSRKFYNTLNSLYIKSSCNTRLAKYIVNTKDKLPTQTVEQIIRVIK